MEANFLLPAGEGILGCPRLWWLLTLWPQETWWMSPPWVGVVSPSVMGCLLRPQVTRKQAVLRTQPSSPTGCSPAASQLGPIGPPTPCGLISLVAREQGLWWYDLPRT